jgi:PPOX class probable F420-dependent enzyme
MSNAFDPNRPGHAAAIERMRTDIVAWLTTVAPDGTPQTSVVCFLWDGETILIYSEPDKPKMRNIAANPRIAFSLNTDPYGDHWVAIEGTARVDEAAPASDEYPAWMAKHEEPYRHWGMDPHVVGQTWNVAVRITPTRVRVW